jgi:hypothetical protein
MILFSCIVKSWSFCLTIKIKKRDNNYSHTILMRDVCSSLNKKRHYSLMTLHRCQYKRSTSITTLYINILSLREKTKHSWFIASISWDNQRNINPIRHFQQRETRGFFLFKHRFNWTTCFCSEKIPCKSDFDGSTFQFQGPTFAQLVKTLNFSLNFSRTGQTENSWKNWKLSLRKHTQHLRQ